MRRRMMYGNNSEPIENWIEKLKPGDFIKLINPYKYELPTFFKIHKVNIFEIEKIENNLIKLKYCEELISVSEISPIPINGVDDQYIYYDPDCIESVLNRADVTIAPKPVKNKDYTYYLEAFKKEFTNNKTFFEIVIESEFKYVHEVQHFLFDRFKIKGLKTNMFKH